MTPAERNELLDSLLDGQISEADFLRIEAELSVDLLARREYYDRLALSILLEAESLTLTPDVSAAQRHATPAVSARRWRQAFAGTAAAAVALLIVVAVLLNSSVFQIRDPGAVSEVADGTRPGRALESEQKASGFAVIAGLSDAVWKDGSALTTGSLVPAGNLHLLSGIVQLELFSGVTVVIEGDAQFAVVSSMEMAVTAGKVRAHVPEPAQGFRIRTLNDSEIVDLGTEFAVDVSADHAEVHVLDGEVEWHPRDQNMRRLQKGEAIRWSAAGTQNQLSANAGRFIGNSEFRGQLASSQQARQQHWLAASESLRNDSRLVAFFQTGSGDTTARRMTNLAGGHPATAGEAAVVAAIRSSDRWNRADAALDFSPAGSRVRVHVPGEHRSLTLLCWVRINSLDRWYNSLFLTDGHDLHEPHWQIMDDGRLFFSVKKNDRWDPAAGQRDKHIFYSPPFWTSALSGQWLMIATVYDVDTKLVTHFLNGQLLSQEAIPAEYLVESVHIGNASLGNWGLPERDDPHFAVRNLNGSMDEFALFSGALSEIEIQTLHENGRP